MGLDIYGRHGKILGFTWICTNIKRPVYTAVEECIESSKLFHYSNYKLTYDVASYVNIVDTCIDKYRTCLANFRGSSHELMIE